MTFHMGGGKRNKATGIDMFDIFQQTEYFYRDLSLLYLGYLVSYPPLAGYSSALE